MPNSIFAEGRTTNEAIENGLKQLNAKREDVIINVIGNEEKRSFFSILEPTKIKVELTLKEPVKIKKANITDEELNEVLETMKKFSNDFFNQLKINNLSINVEEKEKRSEMYKWIDDLEFNFLKLPKPNITFFLHTPVNVIIKLLEKREEKPDGNETNKDYLIKAENSYFELCDLYNFRKIECTQKEQMRSIEEINSEILKIVKENVL